MNLVVLNMVVDVREGERLPMEEAEIVCLRTLLSGGCD